MSSSPPSTGIPLFCDILTKQFCAVPARSKSVMPGEGNAGPGSVRSARSMERPLKAGWLKKQQRGLVKNWHQRYFVLRGSSLTQHKDDKETAVQVRHTGQTSNKCQRKEPNSKHGTLALKISSNWTV